MTRWLVAALGIWLACLILFIVYLCVDAPTATRDLEEGDAYDDLDHD